MQATRRLVLRVVSLEFCNRAGFTKEDNYFVVGLIHEFRSWARCLPERAPFSCIKGEIISLKGCKILLQKTLK